MIVKELIKALQNMPEDQEVVMFDSLSYYTPSKVYVCNWTNSSDLKGKVIID